MGVCGGACEDGKEEVVKEIQNATGGEEYHAVVNVGDVEGSVALACAICLIYGKPI